ncbi:MAG: hypothetical protein AB1641_24735 [Thermodesulfobacteriota bacterium]
MTDPEIEPRLAEENAGPIARRRPYYLSLAPLVSWTWEDRPLDWDAVFGRRAPLELEIGFGNGEALVRRAWENPGTNQVGLEIAWASIKRALRRLGRLKVANVRLLMVDAHLALAKLFGPGSIDRVWSLFPSPWPKEKHTRRRLFSGSFLQLLNSRLTEAGEVVIVTDFEPLLEWISGQTPDTGLSVSRRAVPAGYDTKYERKWLTWGREAFHEMKLVKERHQDVSLVEDSPLISFRLTSFDPSNFSPRDLSGQPAVKFKEFLYDPDQRQGLLRAFVVEDKLIQDFWIRIKDEGGYWFLGLAQPKTVLPTEGVRLALDLAHEAAGK